MKLAEMSFAFKWRKLYKDKSEFFKWVSNVYCGK